MTASLLGCASDEEEPVELPPLADSETRSQQPSATSGPSGSEKGDYSDQTQDDEDVIVAAYANYPNLRRRAQRKPPDERRAYVEQWVTGPELRNMLKNFRKTDREHLRYNGTVKSRIMRVDTYEDGKVATVDDCLDTSTAYLTDARTGREIHGSRGPKRFWGVTYLRETADGWKVFDTFYESRRCTPGYLPTAPASPPRTPSEPPKSSKSAGKSSSN